MMTTPPPTKYQKEPSCISAVSPQKSGSHLMTALFTQN